MDATLLDPAAKEDDLATDCLDIELDIDIDLMPVDTDVAPMITSVFLCTPGCTSPGGGSFCSWCC